MTVFKTIYMKKSHIFYTNSISFEIYNWEKKIYGIMKTIKLRVAKIKPI